MNTATVPPALGPRAALDPLYQFDHVGHEAWPEVKPVLRRALEMCRQIAREGWWN
jgi:hypothetical protein